MLIKTGTIMFRLFTALGLLTLMSGAIGVTPVYAAGIRYAKPAASGTGDCLSWTNACALQTALTGAVSGDEIWVAAGTYKPTTGADRTATFQLINGVAIYGGFNGTETTRDQRNSTVNVTTLSGDLSGNDNSNVNAIEPTRADNSYHVVTGATGAIMDGITITAGNANGGGGCPGIDCGGGIYNNSGSPTLMNITFIGNSATNGGGMLNTTNSSPTLTNVTFSGNSATNNGGGMLNTTNSSPILTNITFSGNSATGNGGGMHNYSGSSPSLTDVTFSGNSAAYGGGMENYTSCNPTLIRVTFTTNSATNYGGGMLNYSSSPGLTDVTFSGNSASDRGGGIYNDTNSSPTLTKVTFSTNSATNYGGGLYNYSSSNPTLTNVTFTGNSTTNSGGGMFNYSSNPVLTNVTISGNSATSYGGGMLNFSGSNPQIRNTIFWDNTAPTAGAQIHNNDTSSSIVNNSIIPDGCPVGSTCPTNIIITNPKLGPLGNYGGFTQTVPILFGSSAFNATSNNCPATDQRGQLRTNPTCDIGAFEYQTKAITTFNFTNPVATGTITEATHTIAVTVPFGTDVTALAPTIIHNGVSISPNSGAAQNFTSSVIYTVTAADTSAQSYTVTVVVAPVHGIRYAKPVAGGTGSCGSWTNACTLVNALNGADSGDEIWVAAGTYKPTTGTDRNATFRLKSGVAIYGGFAGTESTRDQRNSAINITILSGDIGATGNSDNSFNVVIGANNATLDGFTITAGNANGGSWPMGGGMFNLSSSPILKNVTFIDNSARNGGGIANFVNSNPTLTNVTFRNNTAQAGGGMYNSGYTTGSNPVLTNVTFSGNSATSVAGGMYNNASSPTLTNVTFSGNSATNYAGGMFIFTGSSPQIRNTIFWGNTAPTGAQIVNDTSFSTISNSVIQGGCPPRSYNSGSNCTNIITTDPKLGTLGDYGGFTQTIPLLAGSSAIDTGTPCSTAPVNGLDQRGYSRDASCDIGAYEYGAGVALAYKLFLPLLLR